MRVLFTTWEAGGHVPAALMVAGELQRRGDAVLFVSDEATRPAAAGAGLSFEAWRTAPNRLRLGSADDPLDDWRARTPIGVVRRVCEAVMCRPAEAYARDTLRFVETFDPDLIVSQELLFGVMAAAERSQRRLALLTGNLWCFPTRGDLPPFGPGFPPARKPADLQRDRIARAMIGRLYDMGRRDLNAARRAIGLKPLRHTLDQLAAAERILIGSARAFDIGQDPPPEPFRYAGPLITVPDWAGARAALPAGEAGERLVLVSFSTTFQAQAAAVRRCVEALSALPVRAIVTLGPAIPAAAVPGAANVTVVQSASHDQIVPRCALVICHGGHGTVIRPLMHGVPVICLPMGRDQPDNAARIVAHGAGLALSPRAGKRLIRRAVARVLSDPRYGDAAGRLGRAIAQEADAGRSAADTLQALASQTPGARSTPADQLASRRAPPRFRP